MPQARRGLLVAIGGAAIAKPSLPALAGSQHIGKVEAIVRRLPALEQVARDAEEAVPACKGNAVEKEHLRGLWREAACAVFGAEDAALEAEPETVMDALLVIALASTHANLAADFDTNYGNTAERLKAAARYSRRAADFLAATAGHDLRSLLGPEYDTSW